MTKGAIDWLAPANPRRAPPAGMSCRRVASVAVAAGSIAGCATDAAPAVTVAGSFFPEWLVLALVAVVVAVLVRAAFGAAGRADLLPFPLFTCLAVGILVVGAADLLWLGR